MSSFLPKLAIISPCYNEEAIIKISAQKLLAVLEDLTQKSKVAPDSFLYFVDDGSSDSTWAGIESLHRAQPEQIKGLKFSRNFGHQKAILAGLLELQNRADCFITIDVDLQDDPSVIEQFIDAFAGGCDIVYGVKKSIDDYAFFKKYATKAFYALMRLLKIELVPKHSDYRLTSQRALDALARFGEYHLFLRGLYPLLGFKTKRVEYKLTERLGGKTKYPFSKLLSLAIDSITSFSIAPLRLILFIGLGVLTGSFILLVLLAFGLLGGGDWLWVLLVVLLVGGLQIISIGALGEYIGKMYIESKERPRFIKDKELW